MNGLMGELVFTAEHAWTPDSPSMDSPEEAEQLAYAYAVMKALRRGASVLEAVKCGRARPKKPHGRGEEAVP